jgi:hypothetical protein
VSVQASSICVTSTSKYLYISKGLTCRPPSFVDAKVSEKDVVEITGFNIFPNPARGNFKISVTGQTDYPMIQITVINSMGQIVYDKRVNTKDQAFEVTNNFPDGIYLVACTVGNKRYNKSVIIKK